MQELVIHVKSDEEHIQVDLETLVLLNIFSSCPNNTLLLAIRVDDLEEPTFPVDLQKIHIYDQETHRTYAKHPVLVKKLDNCNVFVAGLCSIARELIKSTRDDAKLELLGFRMSCLAACSESSTWTRFCEVDMLQTLKDLLLKSRNATEIARQFPDNLVRFEYHLEQPVRMHNVYKKAREANRDQKIASSVPKHQLNVPHTFSEGPNMSLADLILFPLIKTALLFFPEAECRSKLRLTSEWTEIMAEKCQIHFPISIKPHWKSVDACEINSNLQKCSLHGVSRTNRPFTKQIEVEKALEMIELFEIQQPNRPFGSEFEFDWDLVPMCLRPEGGALPKSRSKRKEAQLENLVKAVLKVCAIIVPDKRLKIVDFCSGSGHLGLLLAHFLPRCEIILVENKERSLQRALDRIDALRMRNIVVVQANLNYFSAEFDIGVALHACGVATDLVLEKCFRNNAHFVVCPCCYGAIHQCAHLKYPRSRIFQTCVELKDYLRIAHAADQTHGEENAKTKQGNECMRIIDTDRQCSASDKGYKVHFGKLMPETCTPKNHLLVGIHDA